QHHRHLGEVEALQHFHSLTVALDHVPAASLLLGIHQVNLLEIELVLVQQVEQSFTCQTGKAYQGDIAGVGHRGVSRIHIKPEKQRASPSAGNALLTRIVLPAGLSLRAGSAACDAAVCAHPTASCRPRGWRTGPGSPCWACADGPPAPSGYRSPQSGSARGLWPLSRSAPPWTRGCGHPAWLRCPPAAHP